MVHLSSKKILTVSLSLMVIILSVVSFDVFNASGKRHDSFREGASIRGSIPKVPYVSNRSFYVLVSSGEKEEMVKLDVTFEFMGINEQECFDRNDRVFRDVMYRFLKDQKPEKNTVREWNAVVKEKVMDKLTANLDRCKIANIVVESVQKF